MPSRGLNTHVGFGALLYTAAVEKRNLKAVSEYWVDGWRQQTRLGYKLLGIIELESPDIIKTKMLLMSRCVRDG